MKPIPLLDYIGSPIFLTFFALLLFLQWKWPLRRRHFSAVRRLIRNFAVSIPAFFLLRLALIPIPLAHTFWAQRNGIGLLNWITLPPALAAVVGFIVMDWAYYWWHWANHRIPFFWRFHNVHHTDLELDVTTAARFHFGEILLSVPFRLLLVVLVGVPPLVYLGFEIVFESATMFHHSNWRLSLGLERLLNHVIVTPRMHGIHHSIVERETDSNWGTIFSWWDKLHRSLRRDISQVEITIGVAAFRDEEELTLGKLLSLPFKRQRPWKLPNGEIPQREPRPADKLQP